VHRMVRTDDGARHGSGKAKPHEPKLALHHADRDGGPSPLTWNVGPSRATKRAKRPSRVFFGLFHGEINGWLKADTIYIARSVSGSDWYVFLRGIMSPRWRSFERTEWMGRSRRRSQESWR
jgi:hypothetical protein